MRQYKGHSVPDCFTKFDPGDLECDACTVDSMCIEAQDDLERRRGFRNRTIVRPAHQSTGVQQTGSSLSSSQMFGAPPCREEVVPREGEHWMSRLGKNMASGALSAAGTEVAYFFKYWRFD